MAFSKVTLNGTTLMDVTQDTVAANKLLNGITATAKNGVGVTGNIANGSGITFNGKTATAGAGYYSSAATANMGLATVVSGTASITSLTYTYNSTNGNFAISGSADVSAPTVSTTGAGYISSSEGTRSKNTGGASVSTTVAKIVGSISISGTKLYTPSITKQSTPSGVTNAASGAATTTAPSTGVYVAVKSAENAGNVTASATISTAGYGTSSYHGIAGSGNVKVGANASAMTYVPITTATPAFDGGTISGSVTEITGSNVTLSDTNNGISVEAQGSATRTAVLYNGAVNGWVAKDDDATALAAPGSNIALTSKTSYITAITVPKNKPFSLTTTADTALDTTSDITISNAAYRQLKITNATNGDVNITTSGQTDVTVGSTSAGAVTIAAYPKGTGTTIVSAKTIVSNGRWAGDSGVKTPSPTTQTGPYYGEIYVGAMSSGTSAAISSEGSVSTAPSVAVTKSTTMDTTTTNTGYSFTVGGTPSNGTVQTKYKVTTAGYAAQCAATNSGTVTVTPSVSGGATTYIKKAALQITLTASTGSCSYNSANSTNVTVSDTNNGIKIAFSGSGTVTAAGSVTTNGYAKSGDITFGGDTSKSSNSATAYKYISGVSIPVPSSGLNCFDLTIPNGNTTDTITWHFEVDSSGNVVITDTHTT